MKNKIFVAIFLILILIANISLASNHTVTMEVVEEPICSIQLGETGKFEKKLISKDLNNKEVTLQLQVTNERELETPTGEIMLVLDDSDSMLNTVSGDITRKDLIFESAKTLVSNFLKNNSKLKIGIVKFSTVDATNEATIQDASVVSPLTADSSALLNAISNIEPNGPRTNLQAGLLLASQQFTSTDDNKYMIVLTDGVPNLAINSNNPYYSDEVISKTKQQLQSLSNQKIELITMLTGIKDETTVPPNVTKNYGQIITEIFGTKTNPTAGSFYYVTDNEIEKTITDDIYHKLKPKESSLKDITIVDYFPEEIVKNFDFAYVSNSNIGTISPKIDTKTNSITWTIPELAVGQTATVQYKLKLKENFDSSIINKILNTNQKVDIEYTDLDGTKQTKTSNISPKLKLTTMAPIPLPKAGSIPFIGLAILIIGLLTFSLIKNNKYKKI